MICNGCKKDIQTDTMGFYNGVFFCRKCFKKNKHLEYFKEKSKR